jgi:hypothetical protein
MMASTVAGNLSQQFLMLSQLAGLDERLNLFRQSPCRFPSRSVSFRDSSAKTAARGSERSRMIRAPFRYARTRNGLEP